MAPLPTTGANGAAKNAAIAGNANDDGDSASTPPASASSKLPVLPESGEVASVGSALGTLPPQGMPALPLPGAQPSGTTANTAPTVTELSPTIEEAPASLPEVQVESDTPKVKTWLTKLAPSVIPPKTNFNYKREVLSEAIYSTSYSSDNSHLPRRVTREDYANLLFSSVEHNNLDATRALLNAGTGLQVTNSAGETPLMVAQRAGAVDVAELLVARGAH